MDEKYRDNNTTDKTGEIMSWVIVFILLFTIWPVGLVLLFRKLRGYAKPAQTHTPHQTPMQTYKPMSAQQQKPAAQPMMYAQQQRPVAQPMPAQQQRSAAQPMNAQQPMYAQQPLYAQQPMPAAQPGPAYHSTLSAQQRAERARKQNKLQKKTGRFISIVLLLLSILMVSIGIAGTGSTISQIVETQMINWINIIMSSFFLFGGIGTFLSRNVVKHRYSRYKNYYAFIGARGVVPLSDLMQVAGVSQKTVIRDIQTMINNGYLDVGTYIDNELECLVLCPEEAEKIRMEIRGAQDDLLDLETEQPNKYMASLAELREVRSQIADVAISEKVAHLEDLTAKIFRTVEESPDKQPEIRRFMSYYLPTTLKLVRSYATLEKQGVKGENIVNAKQSIGNILDTLSTGYEQQLDKLYESDAIDIAADINVLENLMQQDGLTGEKSMFQVLEQ